MNETSFKVFEWICGFTCGFTFYFNQLLSKNLKILSIVWGRKNKNPFFLVSWTCAPFKLRFPLCGTKFSYLSEKGWFNSFSPIQSKKKPLLYFCFIWWMNFCNAACMFYCFFLRFSELFCYILSQGKSVLFLFVFCVEKS